VSALLSGASLYGWFWSNRNSKNESVKREEGGSPTGKTERLAQPAAPLPLEGEA
jgi:hypothetical protein